MALAGGDAPKHDGFAGLHADAGEEELGAEPGKNVFDEVVLAGGDATGEEQQVPHTALKDSLAEIFSSIFGDLQSAGEAANGLDESRDRVAVGVADLMWRELVVEADQFVACGKDGDLRPPIDLQVSEAAGGSLGDLGGGDRGSGWDDDISSAGFGAAADDVFAAGELASLGSPYFKRPRAKAPLI